MPYMDERYADLFAFLEKKCCFHEMRGKPTWTCFHDLRFTRAFCKGRKLDFKKVEKQLFKTGGYCDCEVLFNCVGRISETKELPHA